MAIERYTVDGYDYEIAKLDGSIPKENLHQCEWYKGDDVVAAIRAACEGDTKADVVWFLADKFGIDMTDVEA